MYIGALQVPMMMVMMVMMMMTFLSQARSHRAVIVYSQ